jgi:hypothetical protein
MMAEFKGFCRSTNLPLCSSLEQLISIRWWFYCSPWGSNCQVPGSSLKPPRGCECLCAQHRPPGYLWRHSVLAVVHLQSAQPMHLLLCTTQSAKLFIFVLILKYKSNNKKVWGSKVDHSNWSILGWKKVSIQGAMCIWRSFYVRT